MFSSALKSFSSNITSNYTIAPQPSSSSGPWRIYDAKRKSNGKSVSVFVFDRKSLDAASSGFGSRSNASSLKRAHEEVFERLKREGSSLARLRHPSILELNEPVEETRNGGLMFATEPVTASLAALLQEKDDQERSGGGRGRTSRYVVEEGGNGRNRKELEIDELEIQKGLLQLAKGLEFLHESAGLAHANLTPDAVLINAKGDWKLSGLAFCGPHESSTAATSLVAISLHEVLNQDPRMPKTVQLNLDYTSPDFVLDNSLAASADMFSLGLLIISLYNSPHTSPISASGSISTYKRLFSSSSSIPSRTNNFLVPSSHPLPPKLASDLLPRLITRRAAQRLSAREFQEASYFDNILVSTIRFLDALPAKTANEKIQFMRGLPKMMPQFPKGVLEKKVLPALVEEMKDRDLLAPIMTNICAMVKIMPTGKRAFSDQVVPKLREIFITNKSTDKETSKEAGLMILLENMGTVAENCAGKEFRDDILPIILLTMESPTHALVDASLSTLQFVLPVLDFTTIKNELFPVIANVFSKTSSLNIKIRGLEAFYTLCGGKAGVNDDSGNDLSGIGVPDRKPSSTSSSAILDKYTIQEKVVPLMKGIKTKEPGVMMAALRVFQQVGEVADSDFLAMETLPILWSMSLGPLLNLQQFQAFMTLIKKLSSKIEKDQTRKLQELSSNGSSTGGAGRTSFTGGHSAGGSWSNGFANGEEVDFESLVSGRKHSGNGGGDLMNEWGGAPARPNNSRTQSSSKANDVPTFSWQTPASTLQPSRPSMSPTKSPPLPTARTITPDLASSFAALTPNSSQFSQPMQPSQATNSAFSNVPMRPTQQNTYNPSGLNTSINWSAAANNSNATWSSQRPIQQQSATSGFGATTRSPNSFTLPPPPTSPQALGQPSTSSFPGLNPQAFKSPPQQPQQPQRQQQNGTAGSQKGGLDKYESLL